MITILFAAGAAVLAFSIDEPTPQPVAENATAAERLRVALDVLEQAASMSAQAATQHELDRAFDCCWNPNTRFSTYCDRPGVCSKTPEGKCRSHFFAYTDLADDMNRISCKAMLQ